MNDSTSAGEGAVAQLLPLQEAIDRLVAPGAEFEIETVDIRGVATKTWGGCARNLVDVLKKSQEHGDRDFLVYYDRDCVVGDGTEQRMTYAQHYQAVTQLAQVLLEMGVTKGDRVALAARNTPEWSVAFFAAAATGAIVVPLNAWWTGKEMVYGLNDSGTKVLIADAERLQRLEPHLGEVELVGGVVLDAIVGAQLPPGYLSYADALATAPGSPELPQVELEPDDDATLFYTSGTTGFPKGALGTHRNICSNLRATEFLKRRGEVRTGVVADPEVQPSLLLSVPMFHVTGCHSTLLPAIGGGAKLVLTYRFDAAQTVQLLEKEKVTSFGGVPTLVWRVLESPNFHDHDHSAVVRVGYGGAPAAPELVRRIQEEFPQAAPSNGYGLTESSALSASNAGPEYVAKPTSAGIPVPVCDVKICDEEGRQLDVEEIGELWISGPNIIKGYWNRPEATAETFVDGWLKSGDLARIDEDGFIYICDRAKDMVIRGGENIYCAEVEAALHEHPQVLAAAVYGVENRVLGEEVATTIQLRAGAVPGEVELTEFLRERIASFKVPTVWEMNEDPLPLNANGKIVKRELREAAEARRRGSLTD